MKSSSKKKVAIGLNILLVILEVIGVYLSVKQNGFTLNFYTEDSNMFAMIVSLIFVIYLLLNKNVPRWLNILKYMSVVSLTVTFLVVLFILIPTMHVSFEYMMLKGSMLYHHFLCPVLAFISFIFFDECKVEGKTCYLMGIIFTIIYAIVSLVLNTVGIMYGPYPFLHVYEQPVYMSIVWFILIVGGSYGLAYLIAKFAKIQGK